MKWKKRDKPQWGAAVGLWAAIYCLIIRLTVALTARTIHRLLEGNMKLLTEFTIPEAGFSVGLWLNTVDLDLFPSLGPGESVTLTEVIHETH